MADDQPRPDMLEKGDVEIDVILAVKELPDDNEVTVSAIELAQAFAYVIDEINKDPQILSDVKMGFAVYDTGYKEDRTYAIAENILQSKKVKNKEIHSPSIVLYPSYIYYPDAITSTFEDSNIFIIKLDYWGSTLEGFSKPDDSELKSSRTFTYVSPQMLVAKPIKDLLVHYNWTYVSIVTSDTVSMLKTNAVVRELESAGIRIADNVKIMGVGGTIRPDDYDFAMRQIAYHTMARVVVTLLDEKDTIGLAKAVDDNPSYCGAFVWVTFERPASALSKNSMVINLSKQYKNDHTEFFNYYISLTLENNKINPWFEKALNNYNACCGMDGNACDHPVNMEDKSLDVYWATLNEAVINYAEALDKSIKESSDENAEKASDASQWQMALNNTTLLENMVQIYQNKYSKFTLEQVLADDTTIQFGTWNHQLEVTKEPQWEVLKSPSGDPLTSAPISICDSP